jgi:1-acyl-sn-glycerol-3-phosphate acyltransferase
MNFSAAISPGYVMAQDFWKFLGLNVCVDNLERIPAHGPLLIVSNHRSFLDPLLLTSFLETPINFVCHRYMGNVPILKEILQTCGAFPLTNQDWHQKMLHSASNLLHQGKAVGIFPEGAAPMLQNTAPHHLSPFYRGFAHLALQAVVPNLRILPVAIVAGSEMRWPAVPLSLLHQIDPLEPLFQQDGWHPAVFYQDVTIRVGQPFVIDNYQARYYGKQAGVVVRELTQIMAVEVSYLLSQPSS